jgi:sec-independent protein translocase protein TatA
MFGLGFGELVLIFLIALIFIGPKKLPELAKGLGKGIRDFQNAAKGLSDHLQEDEETPKKVTDASQQSHSDPEAKEKSQS